jgi:hypothetical protein
MMPTSDLEKWANKQVSAAISRGVNVIDAQAAVKAFLRLLPPGADPATYVVPAYQLQQELFTQVADARAAWYENTPQPFKRILDAGTEVTE